MENLISEHDKVVAFIRDIQSPHFKVLDNLGGDKNYIAQLFPDIILINKNTEEPAFIIEVKRNGNIAQCIQQWNSVPSIPATLYIIVPETDLATAKSVAQVVGLQTKFGTYSIDGIGNIDVKYE